MTGPTGQPGSTGRHETAEEQLDRQFDDLLQELRVAQAGVQILFGFLLAIAFTPVFAGITAWQRDVYVATLLATVLATVCFIAPVTYHRVVFRKRMRATLIRSGGHLAIAGLCFLMVAMCGSILLVLAVVVGTAWAGLAAAVAGMTFLVVWWVVPLVHRWRGSHEHSESDG